MKFTGCQTPEGRVMPPGKVSVVDLPLCGAVPSLREHTLYAHRALKSDLRKGAWCVTEAYTGQTVGRGSSRKSAIEAAREAFLRFGEEGFQNGIAAYKRAVERGEIAKAAP